MASWISVSRLGRVKKLLLLALFLSFVACDKKPVSGPPPPGKKESAAVEPISEEKLGVKIFPGAKIITSGEAGEIVSANLRTSEPGAAVVKFYEQELGIPESGRTSGTVAGTKNNIQYGISVIPSDGTTNVSIMGKK
jgi:hypothetical protein